jgi:hypothetical protein
VRIFGRSGSGSTSQAENKKGKCNTYLTLLFVVIIAKVESAVVVVSDDLQIAVLRGIDDNNRKDRFDEESSGIYEEALRDKVCGPVH